MPTEVVVGIFLRSGQSLSMVLAKPDADELIDQFRNHHTTRPLVQDETAPDARFTWDWEQVEAMGYAPEAEPARERPGPQSGERE